MMTDVDGKSAVEIAVHYLKMIAECGIGWSNYVDEKRTHFLTDRELAKMALAHLEHHATKLESSNPTE